MRISKNFDNSLKRGSMMVEVVIVVFIITVSVLSALAVTQKAIYLSRYSVHQAQAAFLLEEGAEATRILRDGGWSNISGFTISTSYYPVFAGGTWTLSTTLTQVGIFTRSVVFSTAYRDSSQNLVPSGTSDSQTRLVTITVSWTEGGQSVSKTLQFYLTDIFS